MSKNSVIGSRKGGLPWSGKMPADLKHYREVVAGKTVIAGSRTFNEPGQMDKNSSYIVLTSSPFTFKSKDDDLHVRPVGSVDEALGLVHSEEDVFVIGGGTIYKQFLPFADELMLTYVDTTIDIEEAVFFPYLDIKVWDIESSKVFEADEQNAFGYTFVHLKRKV